ncbi:MAG: hypothetical protein HZA53_17950 [Planctomycetes bacterium]|nr:hypothetical protein [Planctomycetota bacterium]
MKERGLSGAVFLVHALVAACAAPRAGEVGRAPCPAAFTVAVTSYEFPLALAEELDALADEREPVIACGFDLDARLAMRARALARKHGVVEHAWAPVRALADAWTPIPVDPKLPEATRGLELALNPMPRDVEWAPIALDVSITWRAPDGRILARLPSSAHPLPVGAVARIVCLPRRSRAAAEAALVVFARVDPVP